VAIPDVGTAKAKEAAPYTRPFWHRAHTNQPAGAMQSLWTGLQGWGFGAIPTASAALVNGSTGCIPNSGSFGAKRILSINTAALYPAYMILADRLVHHGGLDATVTTPQTTNLPTAALTRNTSGVGVMMGVEVYTTIGTSGSTVSASYTNSDGTSGSTVFGTSAMNVARRFAILPVQSGDAGVRSVESVTVATTTGTAGNFGITLFKPILAFPVMAVPTRIQSLIDLNNMDAFDTNACLWLISISSSTVSLQPISGDFVISED
jgi:hypothetical protein